MIDALKKVANVAFIDASLAVCPCCGYPTLHQRRGYDVCCLCDWEDDGQDDLPGLGGAEKVLGGPNGRYSLTEARSNFASYRQIYSPSDVESFNGKLKTSDIREEVIDLFDALLPDVLPCAYIESLPTIQRLCEEYYARL